MPYKIKGNNNGITLCNSCHKKTNNYGHKTIINYE